MIEITEVPDINGDGAADLSDVELLLRSNNNTLTLLDGDGDFRSDECLGFLEEADVVVTNPPFSIAREYFVPLLLKYHKKFLIVGDLNWLTYKTIFPLVKENKMWVGYNSVKQFIQPDGTAKKFGNKLWFTNIDIKKRHEDIILYKKYSNEEFPHYDSYDAINVDRISQIPVDYSEKIGVPITFVNYYNPEQFEIIDGIGRYSILSNEETKRAKKYLSMINGKAKYFRYIIKNLHPKGGEDENRAA